MTAEQFYDLYREQYDRHLDEYVSFVAPIQWDMDKINVTVKNNILTLIRPDKQRMKLNVLQVLGLLRYAGHRLQEIDEQETAT